MILCRERLRLYDHTPNQLPTEKAGRPEAVPYRRLIVQVTGKLRNTGKWRVAGIFALIVQVTGKLPVNKQIYLFWRFL